VNKGRSNATLPISVAEELEELVASELEELLVEDDVLATEEEDESAKPVAQSTGVHHHAEAASLDMWPV
jgi:hypothetical protein